MVGRRKIAALVAEFIGAGLLTTMILSVQHSGIGYPLFVAGAVGLAFLVISFTVGEVSGGYYNPALTIGQWVVGKVSTMAAIFYVGAELLGGWAAYYIYTYLVNNHLGPIGGHFTGRILTAEAIGTGIFAFVFAATVYKGYSRAVTASFGGLGLMIGSIAASSGALGLLNPAVALGVRAWVWGTYVLGPIIGAVVGTLLYRVLFVDSDESGMLGGLSMASFTTTREVVTIEPSSKPKAAKKSSAKKKK
jgi:glycerol uptake facilitator-like aquaporin